MDRSPTAVNGCHQNGSPNSWYKHHNNQQVIHMTPVTVTWIESCVFASNVIWFFFFFFGYYFKDCCDNAQTWCFVDVKGSGIALASVHHFSALLRDCSKHNHRRSNQDSRRRERRGLGLHTHPPPHTQHFTAINVHLNLKCRVIGMITLIPSSFQL